MDPDLQPHIDEASRLNNLDPGLLRALIMGESGGDPNATSSAGAGGLTQLMPGSAKGIDPYDPVQAIYRGADILNANLTKAEQLKAGGRDINPVEYALKEYFAGPEGQQWGPKTAAYPGYIASFYKSSGSPTAAQPRDQSGLQQPLSEAEYQQKYPDGILGPPGGFHSPAGATKSPGIADGDNGQSYVPPPQFAQERKSAMDGIDQLAAAGQPQQPAADMPPGLMQLAQAGQPGMSDEELLKGFVDGTLPFMQKPPAMPAPASAPTDAPVTATAPSVAAAANTPNPTSPVALADPTTALYPPALRQHLMTFPEGQQTLAKIIDEEKAGFQRNRDGTFSPIRGGPADPNTAWQTKAGETAGGKLQSIGPNGVVPLPGAVESAAVTEGTLGRAKPYDVEPGKQHVVPPLPGETQAPGANPQSSPTGNASVAGMPGPGGSTVVAGGPSTESNKDYNAGLADLQKSSDAARRALFEAKLLKDRLHQIGTSGPLTESLGALGSLAQQLNVPEDTIKKFTGVKPSTVEQANGLALGLFGEVLKNQFPNRITNTDIAVFRPSSVNANMLDEASNYLLDKALTPRLQRDVERYGAAVNADIPQTPQHLQRFLNKWDNEHPIESFSPQEQSAQPSQKRLVWNPKTNSLEPANP